MDFATIDVETANNDAASICQIGIACYSNGKLVEEWMSYVDPQMPFNRFNIGIHGITADQVKGHPTFPEVLPQLHRLLGGGIAACHTLFDKTAVHKACERDGLAPPECQWLDTVKVARRTWSQSQWGGYGLAKICAGLGYGFGHHDALEDAKAAGFVLLKAMEATGLDAKGWMKRVQEPVKQNRFSDLQPNPQGAFVGQTVVFSGRLFVARTTAAQWAADAGFDVADHPTTFTNTLVVPDDEQHRMLGEKTSSKHRKALEFIGAGAQIQIVGETVFFQTIGESGTDKHASTKKE